MNQWGLVTSGCCRYCREWGVLRREPTGGQSQWEGGSAGESLQEGVLQVEADGRGVLQVGADGRRVLQVRAVGRRVLPEPTGGGPQVRANGRGGSAGGSQRGSSGEIPERNQEPRLHPLRQPGC